MNMRKISLDVLIQLIGMLGILGGLVFVGLEMRQSQQLALAAQQTARMQVWTDIVNAFTESQINYPEGTGDFNPEMNVAHAALWIFENDYIQSDLGLMDENIWQSRYSIMKRVKSREGTTNRQCIIRERAWTTKKRQLDTEFIKLIEAIPSRDCN